MRRSTTLLPALLAAGLLFGACSSPDPDDRGSLSEATPTTPTADPAADAAAADPVVETSEPTAVIARADTALDVLAEPEAGADLVTRLAPTTEFGTPRALHVTDRVPGWVRVNLPVRPNGSSGWVPESAVELQAGSHRVEVDLAARTLVVFADDEVVLETPVAVGAPDAPTPTGTFALIDRLQAPDPNGAYGPFALGLSAHSDTISEFAGGDGQIGIHGTSDPSSIGQAVSHGCVRVPNDVVTRLADLLPLGTPVTIR